MVYDDPDQPDTPTHLDGLEPAPPLTFADWRHPAFLKLCDAHRGGADEYGYRWGLGVVNGCFDLCHIGHINLLHQAHEYDQAGDTGGLSIFLVALLNSDASVARLKGPNRPIVPLPARMWQLAMAANVQVAGFAEDTPEEALERLRPDFLFKGESYRRQEIPGARFCGRVVFLKETPGVSTSLIERKIVAAHGGPASVPRDGSNETPRSR